ncbi:MAG TPA: DUF4166 domain-containing protein, partial [Allosphingosinicella sp.]|nr:DUF4166 domain-containing protein [Allosphingosinicella sp.]
PWHNLGLWLLSWPVRWRWLRRPERFAGLLSNLQHWTRGPGSARSAFEVRLFGTASGRRLERRWTLIADRGDGPEIPSLAVPLLLAKLAAGALPTGARDSGRLLALEDFASSLATIAAAHGLTEHPLPPPLYERVMGERFAALPPAVRAIHEVLRDGGASGEARVTRGKNPLVRLIASVMGFPAEGSHRLHVSFAEQDGRERWTREFSGRAFSSELAERDGLLTERFGPLRFAFDLPSDSGGLRMIIRRWWLGPLPLPLFLAPRSEASEWEEGGRFHFDVPIALPLLGPLVHYRGWLEPTEPTASAASSSLS